MSVFRFTGLSFGVFVFSILMTRSYAGPEEGTLPPSLFSGMAPPAFQASQGMQLANIMTSCQNFQIPIQNAMMSLAQGIGGGRAGGTIGGMTAPACPFATAASVDMVCPGVSQPPDFSSINCNMVLYGGPNSLESMKQQINASLCTVQCEHSKIQALQGELRCLNDQAETLKQQISSLMPLYQQNIMKMQTDMQEIKKVQADRKAQLDDVNLKLNGDPGSKSPGLLSLQRDTKALIAQMPGEIQFVRTMMQKNEQLQKSLDEQIQIRKMGLSMECFNTRTQDNFRCSPNGPPVTAKEYLMCRFEQNQQIGTRGEIRLDAVSKNQARGSAAGLQAVLDQMIADASSDPKIPTSAEEGAKNAQQPLLILSIADVEKRYGNKLRAYKISGTSAGQFVMNMLKSCEKRAVDTVNREQSRVNTTIGQAMFNIREQKQVMTQKVTELLSRYNQQFAANMAGLTGMNIPLNTTGCTNAPPKQQVRCLDEVRTNMDGMLMGNIPNSQMLVQIKGNNPQTFINFKCEGLNGCVTAMQNVSSNLRTENVKIEQFKKEYSLKAKQSVEQFSQHIASQLTVPSQMISNILKRVNSAMSSMGAGAITTSGIRGEQFKMGEDGIPELPVPDLMGIIGPKVAPPLPDLNGSAFSSGMSNLGSMMQRFEGKYQSIMSARVRIETMASSCAMERNQNMVEGIAQQGNSISSCYSKELCESDAGQKRMDAVMAAAARLSGQPGINQASLTSLNTGISGLCNNEYATPSTSGGNTVVSITPTSRSQCNAFMNSLISADKYMTPVGYGGGGLNPLAGGAR